MEDKGDLLAEFDSVLNGYKSQYINQQDAQILVIRLYFLLDALHVSDYISPYSGATFISCTSQLAYTGI